MTDAGKLDRFVVVPASYLFLLRPGSDGSGATEVLLQRRGRTGYMEHHWAAAAAGHVERGETAYDAMRREAAEELDVHDVGLEFLTSMQRTRGGAAIDERIDFFFTARTWTGVPRIVEPVKCLELRWCRFDTLPEPVVPHERVVLEALAATLAGGSVPPYLTHGFPGGTP